MPKLSPPNARRRAMRHAHLPAMLADLLIAADDHGMSSVEIAEVCEVHPVTVAKWRAGTRSPSVENLQPLADHLGLALRDESDDD